MTYRNGHGEMQPDCPLYFVAGRHYRGSTDEEYWWYVRRGLVLSDRIPEVGDLVLAMAHSHPALIVVTQVRKSDEYTYDQYKALLERDPTHEPHAEVRQICDRMAYYQTDSNPGVVSTFIPYTPRSVRAMARDLGYTGDLSDDATARRVMHKASKALLKRGAYKRISRIFEHEAADALASVLGMPVEGPKGDRRGKPDQSRGRSGNRQHGGQARGGRPQRHDGGRPQGRTASRRPASPQAIDAWLSTHPDFRRRLNASIARMARERADVTGMTKRDVLKRAIADLRPQGLPCSYGELADRLLSSGR